MRGIRAVCAISVVALAACSSPAEPQTLDPLPSSSYAPPGETAEDALPSVDAAVREDDVATDAIAALESYFSSANAVARGADPIEHESRYAASCQACTDATDDFLAAQTDGVVADGDRYADWSISVEETGQDGNTQALLTSVIDFAAVNLVDTDGVISESVPAWIDAVFVWTLERQSDGTWLIVSGQQLP